MHEHALLAIMAVMLNAAIGGPRRLYIASGILPALHMPGQWLRAIERKLNRDHRTLKEREMRGAILMGVLMIGGTLLGLLIEESLSEQRRQIFELILLVLLLPARSAWDIASSIRSSLERKSINDARRALDYTPWRHNAALDEHGLSRAGIEIMAIYFSEKIVAPAFWYILLGLPGLFISKLIGMLHENMAQPLRPEEGFGKAAQAIHQMLQLIPSRISAFLWLGAALFLPSGNWRAPWNKLRTELQSKPERMVVASAAACLNLTLGGPASLYTSGQWVGAGTAKAMPFDIKRASYFYALLYLLLFILLWLFL